MAMRAVFLMVAVATVSAEEESANPIRRVVTLLQKMQQKIHAEGEREQGLYDKFQCFCSGNTKGMSAEAEAAAAKISALKAQIGELAAKKVQVDEELVEHKKDREEAKATLAKATSIREKEHEEYVKEAGDQKANIEALGHAVEVLSKGMGGNAFIQSDINDVVRLRKMAMVSTSLSSYEKESVMSFLGAESPYGNYAPASGEIVGILKTMKDNINEDLGGIVSEEEESQRNFNELTAAKEQEIKAASQAIEKKTVRSGELAVAHVEAKNDLEDTNRELSETNKFLANLAVQCKEKAQEWDQRVKTRNDELLAVSEAIKVLNDDDALDIFKKTLPSPGAAKMFLQLSRKNNQLIKAYALLHSAGKTMKSPALNLLAYKLRSASQGVSFDKVNKMVDDMISHLDQEQRDDDKHRVWCNKELEDTDDKKKDLKRSIGDLTKQMESDKSQIDTFASELAELEQSIKDLDALVADATKQRKQEHSEFVDTTSELNSAIQLIEKAKNRLNKFYNPALYKAPPKRELTEEERIARNLGETVDDSVNTQIAGTSQTVSFMQIRAHKDQPKAPETWDGKYQKKGQQTGGVIALLDMLMKDLESQMQEGRHDEETAQKDYEQLMQESKDKRADSVRATTDKTSAKAQLEGRLQETKVGRQSTATEFEDNQKYIASVHGSCDFLLENYDFRKAARANERDALKNAKAVLSGASYSLLQVSDEPAPAQEQTKDLEVNYAKIAPFGKEDTAHELQEHAAKTQDTLVDAVENAEVAEIKRSVFRSLTRLRAASIKEFDTIARLETQAIDAYNDAHHYRAENPLEHLHNDEAAVPTDKLKSFH